MSVGKTLFVSDSGRHTIAHVDRSGLDLSDFPDGLDGVWESSSGFRRQVAGQVRLSTLRGKVASSIIVRWRDVNHGKDL